MDPIVIAEVLEKSGKVHERVRLTHFPAVIGRGYDSDMILSDEFVSAHHAQIVLDETGQPMIKDIDTENGTYLLPAMQPVHQLALGAETLLRLGQTLVRLRRPEFPVAPTRIDTLMHSRLTRFFSSGLILTALGVLLLVILAFHAYQLSAQQIKLSKLLLETLEIGILVPVWAGLWAILSRVFAHHTAYVSHAVIACLAVISFFVADTLAEYYAFGFSAQLSAEILFHALFGLLAALVLYGHLRFATLLSPKRIGVFSVMIAAGVVALSGFTTYVQDLEFNDTLPYPPELKPAQFRIVKEKSLDAFIRDAEQLPQQIDPRR